MMAEGRLDRSELAKYGRDTTSALAADLAECLADEDLGIKWAELAAKDLDIETVSEDEFQEVLRKTQSKLTNETLRLCGLADEIEEEPEEMPKPSVWIDIYVPRRRKRKKEETIGRSTIAVRPAKGGMRMILVDIDGSLAATGELLLSRYKIPIRKYPAPMPDGFWSSPEGLAVYRDVEPIPDSVKALLCANEDIAYFTLRPPIAGFVTIRWLQKHGFPEGPVYFCKSLAEKGTAYRRFKAWLVIEDDPKAPDIYKAPYSHSPSLQQTGKKQEDMETNFRGGHYVLPANPTRPCAPQIRFVSCSPGRKA